jgi:integrase/recombinase XerC
MQLDRFERFLTSQVSSGMLAEGTAAKYRRNVEAFAQWRAGTGEPTVDEMEDFLLACSADRGHAGSTLNVIKCALGKYLTAVGTAEKYMPLKHWFGQTFHVSSGGTPDYLEDDEVSAIQRAAATDARLSAMVALFLRTGMRVGELVALDTDDVVFEDGDGGGYVTIQREKRRETVIDRRTLSDEDLDTLSWYFEARSEYGPSEAADDGALFITSKRSGDGSFRITKAYVRELVTQLGDRADHPDVSGERLYPHLFRHTVGFRLGREGFSASQIGDYLGKGSSAERYTHFESEQHDEMAAVLDRVSSPA